MSLSPIATIFTAETCIIKLALDIVVNPGSCKYTICSDSWSVLQAIQDVRTDDPLIYRV